MDAEEEEDYVFKILIVGDSTVGKSNVLSRFTRGQFNEDAKATIGFDFSTASFNINGKAVMAQFWDTAGQERFATLTGAYFRGAVGAMIVYDITSKVTFKSVPRWLNKLREALHIQEIVIMLVGNKCDLEQQREVETHEAAAFAESNNLSFLETSALNGQNVKQAFEDLVGDILTMMVKKKNISGSHETYQPTTRTENIIERVIPSDDHPVQKTKSGCSC